ncbi:MAG: serine/threonine-protein kinase, partial [Planctomycetota bacterium]
GVAAAHERGVLHRDIKPENVLLGPLGPKLADFGLAKDLDRETLTESGATLGTPGFLAPEQIGSEKARWGETTDVYGLGATLYFALTGRPPFQGPTTIATLGQVLRAEPPSARALNPAVPAWLDALVRQCLAKLNAERPPSALAVRAALMQRPAEVTSRRALAVLVPALALGVVLTAGGPLARRLSGAVEGGGHTADVRSDAAPAAPPPAEPQDVAVAEPVAPAEPASPFASPKALFVAVADLCEVGDFAQALELLHDHPAWVEGSVTGETLLAWSLFALEDFAPAAEAAERAVALDPREGEAYLAWSMSLARLLGALDDRERVGGVTPELLAQRTAYRRDLARCLPWLDRGVESDPQGAVPRRRRAAARLALGLALESLDDCAAGLEVDPQDSGILEIRGRAQASLEAWEQDVLEGRAQTVAGEPDEAVAAYARAAQQVSPKPLEVESCARALLDAGLSELALELLERRWAELRGRPETLTLRGRCALSEASQAGLPFFRRARELDPDHAPALKWWVAGLLELEARGAPEAREAARIQLRDLLEALEREARLQPGNPTLCALRARTYLALGRDGDAERECARGLRIHPRDPPLAALRAALWARVEPPTLQFARERLVREADAASVEAYVRELQRVPPDLQRGELTWTVRKLVAFGRFEVGERLLQLDPGLGATPLGATLLARCRLAANDLEHAAALVGSALARDPSYLPAWSAQSHVWETRLARALEVLLQREDPHEVAVKQEAARRLEACLPRLQEAVAAAPRGLDIQRRLAFTLLALGRAQEASEVARRGAQDYPQDPDLNTVLRSTRKILAQREGSGAPWEAELDRGLLLGDQGRASEAGAAFARAVAGAPGHALLDCAQRLLRAGRLSEAQQALERDPSTRTTARGLTAWAEHALQGGAGEDGLRLLAEALRLDPDCARAQEVRVSYLLNLERTIAEGLDRDPTHAQGKEGRQRVLTLLEGSGRFLDGALLRTPNDVLYLRLRAQILLAQGDPQAARAHCLRGLEVAPDDRSLLIVLHAAEFQVARR